MTGPSRIQITDGVRTTDIRSAEKFSGDLFSGDHDFAFLGDPMFIDSQEIKIQRPRGQVPRL